MKKHPLLFNLILTMAIQIGVYLIIIFELQIIEPILQALGVRSEGIMAPTDSRLMPEVLDTNGMYNTRQLLARKRKLLTCMDKKYNEQKEE